MKQAGFTLLELMIAIALAVILLGIGIPSLGSLLQDNRANYESERLMKHLRFARNQAISDQQTVTACLVNTGNQCVTNSPSQLLVFTDSNSNARLDNGETELSRTPVFSADTSLSSTRTRVLFATDGTSLGTNMTISICVSGEPTINLVIAASGRSSKTDTAVICP
ncbi:type IVa pilus pseudopilin TppE [bacterium 19CA06SA08-2]|uniref:Type IVa pilus pseudopilin TppE n=1 Tax=bacterium 19CA06SA08-2 TaxID=2920658 RepID=A0AAU6U6D6_UNCXX|nr:type IVa pilus pseudopilin TppE [Aeromonas salmonicida subsp. salmonicida]